MSSASRGTNGSDPRYSGFPRFSVDSYENYGSGHDWMPKILHNVVYTYTSNFSWTKGGHEVRFGIDIARFLLDEFHPETNSPRGAFHFAGGVTGLRNGPSTNQFDSYASFLLGLPIDVGKSLQYLGITPRETQETVYPGPLARDPETDSFLWGPLGILPDDEVEGLRNRTV